LLYSVLQQGSGLVDAKAAVNGTQLSCANQGLNITADLNGTQHFMGRVKQRADGVFEVVSPNGKLWDQAYLWNQGFLWPQASLWPQGFLWPQGLTWNQASPYSADIKWLDGYPSAIGSSASTASSMSINAWVPQE
jgi:hypothetical protein